MYNSLQFILDFWCKIKVLFKYNTSIITSIITSIKKVTLYSITLDFQIKNKNI